MIITIMYRESDHCSKGNEPACLCSIPRVFRQVKESDGDGLQWHILVLEQVWDTNLLFHDIGGLEEAREFLTHAMVSPLVG